ncbi:MAG: alanine racemase [Flavobacteriales bacterium]|jgi:alanine racemase|tara:strand:- start:4220 stop:5317 length:1098 start_codon:yes stop_codon:yes gene_type:complete
MTTQQTQIEISLPNLRGNLNFFRSKLNSKTMIMAVVKAYSYGSDSKIISKELELQKIDYLAVAYVDEGVELRENGINIPILVLHPQLNDFDKIFKHELEPSIYSFRILKEFLNSIVRRSKKDYPFQLKFNTGLNRLGFAKADISNLILLLKKLKPTFIFSHLGASEDSEQISFSLNQIKKFNEISSVFDKEIGYTIKKHILNTSGILNFSEYQFDMVRSGIGLYGFGNDPKYTNILKPVISLKTVISQIQEIKKGQSVGYNKGFTAGKTTKSATLPIGHADGISRSYGNGNGKVLINGSFAKIIGNVCMDMLMVDVTNISCKEGDQVIIFNDTSFSAEEFASTIETISYEILTALSSRIRRVVIK